MRKQEQGLLFAHVPTVFYCGNIRQAFCRQVADKSRLVAVFQKETKIDPSEGECHAGEHDRVIRSVGDQYKDAAGESGTQRSYQPFADRHYAVPEIIFKRRKQKGERGLTEGRAYNVLEELGAHAGKIPERSDQGTQTKTNPGRQQEKGAA